MLNLVTQTVSIWVPHGHIHWSDTEIVSLVIQICIWKRLFK